MITRVLQKLLFKLSYQSPRCFPSTDPEPRVLFASAPRIVLASYTFVCFLLPGILLLLRQESASSAQRTQPTTFSSSTANYQQVDYAISTGVMSKNGYSTQRRRDVFGLSDSASLPTQRSVNTAH